MSFEQQVERLVGAVSTLAGVCEQNTQAISRLEGSVESLVNVSHEIITELQRQGAEIREMQAEIRGLQTENRHILDHLLNRDGEQG
jgi:chromosome segregation ATPase